MSCSARNASPVVRIWIGFVSIIGTILAQNGVFAKVCCVFGDLLPFYIRAVRESARMYIFMLSVRFVTHDPGDVKR